MYLTLLRFINADHIEFGYKLVAVSYTSCMYVVSILIVFLSSDTQKIATAVTETCWCN
jgi:hypothetical protein